MDSSATLITQLDIPKILRPLREKNKLSINEVSLRVGLKENKLIELEAGQTNLLPWKYIEMLLNLYNAQLHYANPETCKSEK